MQAAVDSLLRAGRLLHLDRLLAVPSAHSTQDLAREACGGRPGLIVLAGRQEQGRGRLGRPWHDPDGLGLAMSFVLPASPTPGVLSIQAGLAACMVVEAALFRPNPPAIGVRWPNDVVEMRPSQRKFAGVLIEQTGDLALVGIGINVLQHAANFPPQLAHRAVSLGMLGSTTTRARAAASLAQYLDCCLDLRDADLLNAWRPRDVLAGTRRTLEHRGVRYSGTIVGLDPLSHVELIDDQRGPLTLPALTTSLVHDAPDPTDSPAASGG
jgi:BirA family transcriptional regulator, biotin operon repressor / biotin---[acetyl-CoA-carboxylase] ligase